MKIFALSVAAVAALSAVEASEQASIHLRIHDKGGSCTITNESQCNGQSWTGSTCCADSNYECRWSDDGQNVQRCQKKKGSGTTGGTGTTGGGGTVGDWGDCSGGKKCKTASSVCVKYSNYYSQCKPATLPSGELCGQKDAANDWKYDKCPSNQKCSAMGTDFRCTNKKHRRKAIPQRDWDYCTITNESQCDGQNWSDSTCCADPNYECRWSDDGQNVKRCQTIDWYDGDYAVEADNDKKEATTKSYVDVWGDCSASDAVCADSTNWCVQHSDSYWQCKPATLGNGELCGQHDGTNEWDYPMCPVGQTCQPLGTDMRCA